MNSYPIRLLVVFGVLLLTNPGHATPLPQQFTAVYTVKKSGITIGMVGWRLSMGWTHVPSGAEIAVFTVLLGAATGIAARLGMLGGKLVFGH